MLENNTDRILLAIVAIAMLSAVIGLMVYLVGGGADSFWSFFSWLNISNSSANI